MRHANQEHYCPRNKITIKILENGQQDISNLDR